jgi:hypothetical protein
VDGDTVDMERLGRVRLIGVDAPEEKRCYESEATRFTRERLEGKVVQYELGVERKDPHGRTLAYLTRERRMHNEDLLEEVYAKVLTIPPNDKYAKRFEEAERSARGTDAGLWNTCDRNKIRARRAAAQRRKRKARARRIAARERRRARRARARARRAEVRRLRAERRAERRRQAEVRRQQEEQLYESPSDPGGAGGGTPGCLPASACPGKRDGDGDGCYCE